MESERKDELIGELVELSEKLGLEKAVSILREAAGKAEGQKNTPPTHDSVKHPVSGLS